MGYENTAGINVSNHYGPRVSGGEVGTYKTEGFYNEFVINLPLSGLATKFPVRNNVKVVGVNSKMAAGSVSSVKVGGVEVVSATESSPVAITDTNTGVISQTGGTGGYIVIRYINVAGDAFDWSQP